MKCQNCGSRDATVHLTNVVNNKKAEIHLCDQCAEGQETANGTNGAAELMQDFFSGVIDSLLKQKPSPRSQPDNPTCDCGLTLQDLIATQKPGCPKCYETFKIWLMPVLKLAHDGHTQHVGKVPPGKEGTTEQKDLIKQLAKRNKEKQLKVLRSEMDAAVKQEAYERAGKLRDQITALEKESDEESKKAEPSHGRRSHSSKESTKDD